MTTICGDTSILSTSNLFSYLLFKYLSGLKMNAEPSPQM